MRSTVYTWFDLIISCNKERRFDQYLKTIKFEKAYFKKNVFCLIYKCIIEIN